MRRFLIAAVLAPVLFQPVVAQDLSREAKLLLYCTAASVVAGKQLDNNAIEKAIGMVKVRTRGLLAAQGVNDELLTLLAITSVEEVLDELQNNRPRYYSQDECEDVLNKRI